MERRAARRTRRGFLRGSLALAGLGVVAACGPVPAPGRQVATARRIGYLEVNPAGSAVVQGQTDAFRQGLSDRGYAEGRDITVEWRFADGVIERIPDLAAELARLPVEVIVAVGNRPIRSAREASGAIPIVMVLATDPVRSGLVASLARPGGNVTGLSQLSSELAGKRLELLRDSVPGLASLGFLWNPDLPDRGSELQETESAARALGLRVRPMEARSLEELEAAFGASGERPHAVFVQNNFLANNYKARIAELALRQRLPTMSGLSDFPAHGGLMAYGPQLLGQFRRAADYVDKILKGASPAHLPVEQPTTFDFVINLKTAHALGLTIPPSVLQQATEVLQ